MSSTLSFLDQFNAPSTEGGKRISIYTPKHTHVGDSALLTLLLSNPTDVFNKLKTHNPEATNATDRAALEAYLSAHCDYDEAVKAANEAIDHHKRLLRQQDDRILTELIRLDNLKVAHRFQPLLPRNLRARHNKFIPRAIPNVYLPLPAPLPTSAFRRPRSHPLFSKQRRGALPSRLTGNPTLVGPQREAVGDADRLDTGDTYPHHLKNLRDAWGWSSTTCSSKESSTRRRRGKEKKDRRKAVPIPPPCSANPEPPTSPIAGPSHPRPDTPVVFRKVDPDWTPDVTQWTWDSSWPNQKHLSGEEWSNVGRNARKEWFDEKEDNSVDWELYGDGEQAAEASLYTGGDKGRLCALVRAQHADAAPGAAYGTAADEYTETEVSPYDGDRSVSGMGRYLRRLETPPSIFQRGALASNYLCPLWEIT
ncbi:predicted protein [Postia placenta Mad-698-R]|nr:predicted protein [Postia placenta Mad-698-R]